MWVRLVAIFCLALLGGEAKAWTHGSPGISYNITSAPFNAACNGNLVRTTATLTISAFPAADSNVLHSSTALWGSGDVGKWIIVTGAGGGMPPGELQAKITAFTSSTQVTLSQQASTALSSTSTTVVWGTDDSPAFIAWNTVATAQTVPVTLTIPSGKSCQFLSQSLYWAAGIKNLTVMGYGATITNGGAVNPGFHLGGHFVESNDLTKAAKTATVAAGATCVTMITSSDASKFVVGDYAIMSGFDMQGGGQPPNWEYFDYLPVSAVDASHKCDGSAGGSVSFGAALKYGYKSTWPSYDAFQGGPATLWALPSDFNAVIEYRGLTISQDHQNTYAKVRSVTFRDVTFTGRLGWTPSQCMIGQAINSTYSMALFEGSQPIIEVDKLITTLTFTNTNFYTMNITSSSVDTFTMNGGTVQLALNGGAKRNFISNATIGVIPSGNPFAGLQVGTLSLGHSDEYVISNTFIEDFAIPNNVVTGLNGTGINHEWSMAGGVITIPNTQGPQAWAVPGTNVMWGGALQTEHLWQVVDVTQSGSNTLVQTSLAGGFPPASYQSGGVLSLRAHLAPKWTCTSCTGAPQIVGMSGQTPATPLFSYWNQVYPGTIGTTQQFIPTIWGTLVSVQMNVTNASSNASSFFLSAFNNLNVLKSNDTILSWNNASSGPGVNTQITGLRTITPGSVTGTQTGDAGLTAGDPFWFGGKSNSGPAYFAAPSAGASVTLTIQADQGVVNP